MLRAQRGAGGWVEGDLDEIPRELDGDEGDGHDRNHPNNGKEQRDYLKRWFNGAVPWQDGKV